jgi:hypothetical protein
LALDTYGHPHVAYYDETNSAVKYARWIGGEWRIEIVEARVGEGDAISLALDSENQPHISYYYSGPDDHALKYATTSSAVALSDMTCVPAVSPVPPPTEATTPTPTNRPPLPLPTEETSSGPIIRYFRADVEEVDPGGTVVFEWESEGATEVTLLHTSDGTWFQSEIELEPSGTFAYEMETHQEDKHAVFHLRARDEAGHTTMADLTISVRCPNTWFFALSSDICPSPPLLREAAEQHFEHGTMIWVEGNWTEGVSEGNWVFVLYDDGLTGPKWATYPDEWEESDPDRDPTLTPPPNLCQPVRGFGLVWRQNPDVRNRLGWAVDQETGFGTVIQRTMVLKYSSIYLRALDGNVWHLFAEQSGWEKILVEN